MKRRTFLHASAISAAAWPAFVQRAFALPCDVLDERAPCKPVPFGVADVEAAWQAARAAQRPLLVLVVPEDPTLRWTRGQLWGELLNFGTDEQLAPLGLTEVVCASMAALATLVPIADATRTEKNTVAFVIEPRVHGAQTAVSLDVPEYKDPWARGSDRTPQEREAEEERVGRARIAALAGAVRAAVVTPARKVDDAAALATRVRSAIVATGKPPRGAEWASSTGCGIDVENGPPSMVDCGMGHTPKLSRRFLSFLVAPPTR